MSNWLVLSGLCKFFSTFSSRSLQFDNLRKYLSAKFFDYLWPIHSHEAPKFLLQTLLMFCILAIQNLIRATKDSIIATLIAPEAIPFLKFYGVMPVAFLVTIIYLKLINSLKEQKTFYLILSFFLLFFLLFGFYLFPNYHRFHLSDDQISHFIIIYPQLKWFIMITASWSFSLFYIMAELWPNLMFALLFWQFINKVTNIEESRRFYPVFGLFGQTSLYICGLFLINLPEFNEFIANKMALNIDRQVLSIQIILSIVILLGLIALTVFWVLSHLFYKEENIQNQKITNKIKENISLIDSFKIVFSSRYIMLIALLLICYGAAINLVEGPWKSSAQSIYKTPTEFSAFIGQYIKYTGIFTVIFVLFASNIVRKLGWCSAAIITPLMVFITGILYFLTANFHQISAFIMLYIALSDPALISVTIGAVQNILSKSSKYTLFDSTKEMAYVPLDDSLKRNGKAVEGASTKIGKALGALVQSGIFIIFPGATYAAISKSLMVIFSLICLIWIYAVISLNKAYKKAVLSNK